MEEPGGLTLRVLGELDAVRDGVVIDLGGRRQRAVLAALIIARGDVVSAERLAECVWGDGAAARSGGPLHSYVSHLRRRMQPDAGARGRTDVIVRVGAGYSLSIGPTAVDAWWFEHELEAATGLAPTVRPSSCATAWPPGAAPPTRSTPTNRGPAPRWPDSPNCGRSRATG